MINNNFNKNYNYTITLNEFLNNVSEEQQTNERNLDKEVEFIYNTYSSIFKDKIESSGEERFLGGHFSFGIENESQSRGRCSAYLILPSESEKDRDIENLIKPIFNFNIKPLFREFLENKKNAIKEYYVFFLMTFGKEEERKEIHKLYLKPSMWNPVTLADDYLKGNEVGLKIIQNSGVTSLCFKMTDKDISK